MTTTKFATVDSATEMIMVISRIDCTIALYCVALCCVGLDWNGLDWIGLDWIG